MRQDISELRMNLRTSEIDDSGFAFNIPILYSINIQIPRFATNPRDTINFGLRLS